jgi:phosphatidylserine/phosphatidylglycerophosphate/cardiolipin synthase-like enzyme
LSEEPKYWGTWKGRVIKYIAIDRAFTWEELRDLTGLSRTSLNIVLSELYDAKALHKNENGEYRVNYELYKEYMEYFESLQEKIDNEKITLDDPVRISKDQQSNLIVRLDAWKEFRGLDISLRPKHFFIDGDMLDDVSKDLISNCLREVLVVNPFVDKCNLSDQLMDARIYGKEVILITRPPSARSEFYTARTESYHKTLLGVGVKITYNDAVHAKMIVLDRAVAIVSSMNFYSSSTAGVSWEAGIVTFEDTVVESITNAILGLLEKPDSIQRN